MNKAASAIGTLLILAVIVMGVFNIGPVGHYARRIFYQAKGTVASAAKTTSSASKDPGQATACRNQLMMIESAKAGIRARGQGRAAGEISWGEVMKELNIHKPQLTCPAGGSYMLGSMSVAARCSISGNDTPDASDDHMIKSY